MRRLANILFWSILAAAFVGPGTVTTAASAGANFGFALLWALLFSTLATIVLQEMAARLTIASGMELGDAIARRHGATLRAVAGGAVILGCGAYEAGNFAGAIRGLQLLGDLPRSALLLGCATIASSVLWISNTEWVARILGAVVALMGICFVGTAIALRPDMGAIGRGLFVPSLPDGGNQLALGLIGTTVVPYNLFLGSALARGRSLGEARIGLVVAIALGGLISAAILVAGSELADGMDFVALAEVLHARLGPFGAWALGIGLFAAGLSSAITAPLAAAFAARTVFGRGEVERWALRGRNFRIVWLGVLGFGAVIGISQLPIVPIIVSAQVVNGLLLPLCAFFLLAAMNDRQLLPKGTCNRAWSNVAGIAVLLTTVGLGLRGILRALGLPLLCLALASCSGVSPKPQLFHVTISAQSLMQDLIADWQPTSPDAPQIQLNFASSRDLRAQLERGAPGELVLLADWNNMDQLLRSPSFAGAQASAAFRNELIAIAREALELSQLAGKRVGIGEPGVPVGDYARRCLSRIPGAEQLVESAILLPHEAALVEAVRRGALDAAFVYRSSIGSGRDGLVEIPLPASAKPEVEYAIAARGALAEGFVRYLQSDAARTILVRHGFQPIAAP